MPRQIDPEEPFDAMRDEINFTAGRIEDEPLSAAFASRTAEWLARVDEAEKTWRAIEREETSIEAARAGGNLVLDAACSDFGDDLLPTVDKDRSAPRWRAFFRSTVSEFIRQPLHAQVVAVRGWLTESTDEVLLRHKPVLEVCTARVERAIAREDALAERRAAFLKEREALATYLTLQRDDLHSELSVLARANRLARIWADSFFRGGRGVVKKKLTPMLASQPSDAAGAADAQA